MLRATPRAEIFGGGQVSSEYWFEVGDLRDEDASEELMRSQPLPLAAPFEPKARTLQT